MADLALAEAPMADLPFKAVRLKLAKKPRKVRQPNPKTKAWVQCRSEDKHGYKCGKWFKGNNMLDRHVKDCHEGMLDGDCLGCGRSFKTKTALRYHCQHVCTPSCLPTRHIPQKGKEALLWQTLLAEPAELQEALLGEEEEAEQQHQQLIQTALLCGDELEREEEQQQQQQLPPPPGAAPAAE